ncbi:MAG: hypothetical protein Q8M22_01670 [Actinomycetota bacterium]|nr:hypothetical protein [Actinomycetota bacterium]
MLHASAPHLPTPITFAPVPPPAPTPAPRGHSKWLVAAAAALAVGVAGWVATRDDGDSGSNVAAPAITDGSAGNGSITREELSAAYTATFGVLGSSTALDCVAAQMGGAGSQAERLARGELLTFAEAAEAFTPFVTCAPDADFLAMMVPSAVEAFGGGVDEACVTQRFLSFGVQGRAEARALALVDLAGFASSLQATFADCAF